MNLKANDVISFRANDVIGIVILLRLMTSLHLESLPPRLVKK